MSISSMFRRLPPAIQQILDQNSGIPGQTPPFVPGQTPPIAPPITPPTTAPAGGNRFLDALNSPTGQFAARLLASSGPSLAPQSTLSNIGTAALGTIQDQRQRGLDDLQRRLLESRIGLNQARATQGANPTAGNVQSTFRGENGNMFIVTRAGEVKDTGVAFNETLETIERPDGSVVVLDRSSGQVVGTPVTSEEAVRGAATITAAREEAKGDPGRARALPISIQQGEQKLQEIEGAITALESGELDTGPLQGIFAPLTAAGQRFGQLSGQQVIDAISSATFGQLSEGEREFLRTTTIDTRKDEQVNIEGLRRMADITRKALEIERQDLARIQQDETDEVESFRQRGFSIP